MKNKILRIIGEVCLFVRIGIFIVIMPFETFMDLAISYALVTIVCCLIGR